MQGHQDTGVTTVLPKTHLVDIKMDFKAKSAVQPEQPSPGKYTILGEGWCCYIKTERTTKQITTCLHAHQWH